MNENSRTKLRDIERLLHIQDVLDEHSIVSVTDENGIITYVNKEFCRISGYTVKELLGQNHRIIKSEYHPPEFYKGLWKTISSGHIWKSEIKNKAKDGSFYWVKTIIVPFLDDNGKTKEYYSIRTDITEQKRIQEELIASREDAIKKERLSTIGELASRIAHDLRNPLSIIKSTTTLLQLQPNSMLDEKTKNYLSMIDKAVLNMTHQINDILDFIRIRELQLEKNSIKDIIHYALQTVVIPENITINLPQNDVYLQSDKRQLEVLVSNLISNAIDAIGEKIGSITIRLDEDSQNAVIEVEDSGSGIPEDVLPHIFKPLFTTKQKGTGLGLVSCDIIVQSHKGKIDVMNKPTRFRVILTKIMA